MTKLKLKIIKNYKNTKDIKNMNSFYMIIDKNIL
jgi:hypothetical protein